MYLESVILWNCAMSVCLCFSKNYVFGRVNLCRTDFNSMQIGGNGKLQKPQFFSSIIQITVYVTIGETYLTRNNNNN